MGEVGVCVGQWSRLYLTCEAHGALWSTSGFKEGLSDQAHVPALTLANSSFRVTTTDTDTSTWTNYSTIILSDFQYADHGATVTCEDAFRQDSKMLHYLLVSLKSSS